MRQICILDPETGTIVSLGTHIKIDIDNKLEGAITVDAELAHHGELPDGNLRGPFVLRVTIDKPKKDE